jgi:hypothetical protein
MSSDCLSNWLATQRACIEIYNVDGFGRHCYTLREVSQLKPFHGVLLPATRGKGRTARPLKDTHFDMPTLSFVMLAERGSQSAAGPNAPIF